MMQIQRVLENCKYSHIWYEFLPLGAWNIIKNHIDKTKCSKASLGGGEKLNYKARPCIRKYRKYLKKTNTSECDNEYSSDIIWDCQHLEIWM